jgi:DNA invertase Pin-like site-specific DNA recombinase
VRPRLVYEIELFKVGDSAFICLIEREPARRCETFQSLGIEFVSLTEGVDTSTPMGKMVFTVLGAVAELERSLIVERVKAGLRNARAKGKRLGRPRRIVDVSRVACCAAKESVGGK